MDQISMFDLMYPTFKTDKPVRLYTCEYEEIFFEENV